MHVDNGIADGREDGSLFSRNIRSLLDEVLGYCVANSAGVLAVGHVGGRVDDVWKIEMCFRCV